MLSVDDTVVRTLITSSYRVASLLTPSPPNFNSLSNSFALPSMLGPLLLGESYIMPITELLYLIYDSFDINRLLLPYHV